MEKLTFGSLFAGIGGFDLGFERAGLKCEWQVEIDDYATKVLEKHWPKVRRQRDIRECGKHNLEYVDVICGGFPCQDISAANTEGKGLAGHRSSLWFEYKRIIRELGPGFVVIENVRNLLIRGFDQVLRDLAVLGYDAEWEVLRASQFGARHSRERVFIVAYPVCDRLEGRRVLPQEAHVPSLDQVHNWPHVSTPYGLGSRNGFPNFVDRLRGLGNAVVPQIAEWIGRQIIESSTDAKNNNKT